MQEMENAKKVSLNRTTTQAHKGRMQYAPTKNKKSSFDIIEFYQIKIFANKIFLIYLCHQFQESQNVEYWRDIYSCP